MGCKVIDFFKRETNYLWKNELHVVVVVDSGLVFSISFGDGDGMEACCYKYRIMHSIGEIYGAQL